MVIVHAATSPMQLKHRGFLFLLNKQLRRYPLFLWIMTVFVHRASGHYFLQNVSMNCLRSQFHRCVSC